MAYLVACAFWVLAGCAAGELAEIQRSGAIISPSKNLASATLGIAVAPSKLTNISSDALTHVSSEALKYLDLIYEGHSLHAFWKVKDSAQAAMEAKAAIGVDRKAILYGEVLPMTFVQLLQHVGAKPGQKYYDLGSGTGKTVFAAWLLGLDATGVELVSKRWTTACTSLKKAKQLGFRRQGHGHGVNFVHASFLDVDFSDADVVFADSSTFSPDMMEGLARVGRGMKPGAKIISTLGFPGDGFYTEGEVVGPSAGSKSATWTIQTRTSTAVASPSAGKDGGAGTPEVRTAMVKVANLMRQEPATPSQQPKKKEPIHMNYGTMTGALVPDAPILDSGSSICSLAEGKASGIAARMAQTDAGASVAIGPTFALSR